MGQINYEARQCKFTFSAQNTLVPQIMPGFQTRARILYHLPPSLCVVMNLSGFITNTSTLGINFYLTFNYNTFAKVIFSFALS